MTNGSPCDNIFKHSGRTRVTVGVYSIEVPPVPIPNTVVKLNCAENTWRAAAREDRSSPTQRSTRQCALFFYSGARGQGPGARGQGPGVRGQGPGARGQGSGVRGQGHRGQEPGTLRPYRRIGTRSRIPRGASGTPPPTKNRRPAPSPNRLLPVAILKSQVENFVFCIPHFA